MAVWFEGSAAIDCSIDEVKRSLDDLGAHYLGVIRLMPGLTRVDLVAQEPDSVTLQTNEGLMTRTNITRRTEAERVVVELDEQYRAGFGVTATTHFLEEFTSRDGGVVYHTVLTDVEASGVLGFFYRRFGSANIGKAFLASTKTYLEDRTT